MKETARDWKDDEANLRRQLAILAAGVQIEDYGNEFYTRMSERIRDKEGKIILQSLAQDEKQHRAWLERQIDRIFPGCQAEKIEPDPAYSIDPSRLFALPQGSLSPQDEISGVEMAIEVEKRSARLYDDVAGMTKDPELRAVMQRLARWERGHQKILENNLHYLKRGGSWYGYTPILDG